MVQRKRASKKKAEISHDAVITETLASEIQENSDRENAEAVQQTRDALIAEIRSQQRIILTDEQKELFINEACEVIAEGGSLADYCKQMNKPCFSTIYKIINSNDEFRKRFDIARAIGDEAVKEQILEIIDTEPERDENGKPIMTSVMWLRSRAEVRLKWLLGMSASYRQKEVKHSGNIGISVNTGVPGRLIEAEAEQCA